MKKVNIFILCYCSNPRLWYDYLSVSEVPKEAPTARKYDSRYELEEVKSTEQMKEDVSVIHNTLRLNKWISHFIHLPLGNFLFHITWIASATLTYH